MVRVERVAGRSEERLVFDSSEVVYHVADKSPTWRGGGPFEVAKYAYGGYGGTGGPGRTELWRRVVPMRIATWARAPDGPWLALGDGGRRVLVLDTATGDHALAFPTLEDVSRRVPEGLRRRQVPGTGGMNYVQRAWALATLERLRGVLGAEATVEDVGGLGGDLVRGRQPAGAVAVPGPLPRHPEKGVRRLRHGDRGGGRRPRLPPGEGRHAVRPGRPARPRGARRAADLPRPEGGTDQRPRLDRAGSGRR